MKLKPTKMQIVMKCFGSGCLIKSDCQRYKMRIDDAHGYFKKPPYDQKTNTCEFKH